MRPLRVTAQLRGPIVFRDYIHLDSLLAYAVCVRDGLPMATREDELVDVEIPVERSACCRFHLASASVFSWEFRERAYLIRRFPLERVWHHSDVKRVNLAAGAQKHHRIPYERGHLEDDLLTWFLVADQVEVEGLLSLIHYLGGRRAAGNGRVKQWSVEPLEETWEGFPVLLEGQPLRNLPDDYPGTEGAERRYGNLSYPYWRRSTEEVVACPARC